MSSRIAKVTSGKVVWAAGLVSGTWAISGGGGDLAQSGHKAPILLWGSQLPSPLVQLMSSLFKWPSICKVCSEMPGTQ